MVNNSKSIRFITGGLVLIYGLSVFLFKYFPIENFELHNKILTGLFGLLLAASIGALFFQEWARKILVSVNLFLVFYLLLLYIPRQEIILTSYAFMSCITVLFFGQETTRILFQDGLDYARKSVLIVDDDPAIVKTIKPVLLKRGYSVLTAPTGEKGMQIAFNQRPDIIVLDVLLPGIKGRQVCAKLKEDNQTKDIPVIFLTAKDSPDDVKAEMDVGAVSHVTKPFSAQKLLDEITKALS